MASNPTADGFDSRYIGYASADVDASKLDDKLKAFLSSVAILYFALFDRALEITSANDGNHAQHSAHYLNAAVDLRCHDIVEADQILFGLIMAREQRIFDVVVLDERYTKSPHWHIQTAASIGG